MKTKVPVAVTYQAAIMLDWAQTPAQ